MKTNLLVKTALLLAVIMSSLSIQAQQTLTLGTIDNYKPFYWQEAGTPKGSAVDVLLQACKQASITCNIKFMPWKRMLKNVEDGTLSGGFAAFKTPEREAYSMYTSHPLHYSTFKVFVKKGSEFAFESTADLYGKRIGVNRGFSVGSEIESAAASGKLNLIETNTTEQNLKKLSAGRIDGYISNADQLGVIIKQMNMGNEIVSLPRPTKKPQPAFLIFSKKSTIAKKEVLIQKLNAALKSMYDSAEVEKIEASYR